MSRAFEMSDNRASGCGSVCVCFEMAGWLTQTRIAGFENCVGETRNCEDQQGSLVLA